MKIALGRTTSCGCDFGWAHVVGKYWHKAVGAHQAAEHLAETVATPKAREGAEYVVCAFCETLGPSTAKEATRGDATLMQQSFQTSQKANAPETPASHPCWGDRYAGPCLPSAGTAWKHSCAVSRILEEA
ncbi:hypothetical protein TGPRC2_210100 [Toxoplasma gondii TgCatPRC2]|uniref:Uncharacterized protein n=3 Tax=Toxoplasma gondii TaxID=5811 RepID=A0A151GZ36_TOXGO|nr:hypothetical protein TGME49_210100 [Toxoplasma gondii ME49]EPT32263.1 hypothetical protein TGME49_210100 [Toxoplasma gondii ME49]KFG29178.1 hypothetical protein TGDOM2_210100 [Toxoplasma gondii GAB2-2007-GAL-DOM2]KYK62292.1 hypothetical protein TGPRC2_210100 [Toxoplasma gondii TgCatPRC2]|eukprot:XP_002369749.1 hypothetical protein TGME49_210100 [Toxoplasma gondii ME49]